MDTTHIIRQERRGRGAARARLLLCRLKRSELTSSTGVTSFILRLSFPSLFSAVSSTLSPDTMALAAIVTSAETSPTASDFSEKDVISAGKTFHQDQTPDRAGGRSSFQVAATREPTNRSAVSQRLLQLVDERRRGADDRTNQLALFRKSEVEGNLCRKIQTRYTHRPDPRVGSGPPYWGPDPQVTLHRNRTPGLPPELSLRLRSLSPSGSGPALSEATSTFFA